MISLIILIGTTIGAGIFSLPYVFYQSGWFINLIYFLFLGIFLTLIHYLYSKIIIKFPNYKGFLELIKNNFHPLFYPLAFLSIIVGLILTLLVYIILGGKFLNIILPNLSFNSAVLIFWLFSSISFLMPKFFNRYEILGTLFIVFIIILVFLNNPKINYSIQSINLSNLFLPFGPILFSLTGWTAIRPMLKQNNFKQIPLKIFILSMAIIIMLYLMFILGIINASRIITEEAISGLNWPYYKLTLLSLLGIFAIWTSYLPIGIEIKNSLSNISSSKISNLIVVASPIILFSFLLQDFLKTINLAGGIFLALQYIFILILIKKNLNLNKTQKLFFDFLKFIFLGIIIYEIYFFIF